MAKQEKKEKKQNKEKTEKAIEKIEKAIEKTQGKEESIAIEEEMKKSYIDYAMSVIVARALPSVEDGLKPVQRRILYAMYSMGLVHGKPTRKTARIVGEVLGKYHPHGDIAVYDALVRMAQSFSLRYPLIRGQGNFGCFTADTKIALTDGRNLSFKELIEEDKKGKKNFTYTINKKGIIEIAEIKSPRLTRKNQAIMKVILDNGEEIICTPDHKFMLRDGSYKEARNLTKNDSLMPFHKRISKIMGDPETMLETIKNYNHKIKKIEWIAKKIDVYDLEVPETHNFALTSGVFVHNSIDGDPPAAQRYTECKLRAISEEIIQDIEKKTVKMLPNFDNSLEEPEILPGKVPNLLINGSQGIAVGMTTNIPPHNLTEVCDAILAYLKNEKITIEQLMKYIQGPDFPSAGAIYSEGIYELYKEGRGSFMIRGRATIEEKKGKERIIISELPYQVNKSDFIKSIADLARAKKIPDISNIRDESAKDEIRIVVIMRKGANSRLILNRIFKYTALQTKFNAILLALVEGQPKILDLFSLIKCYVDYRKEIIKKRTKFDLDKAQALLHILDGFLIALKSIDDVIKTIKSSKHVTDAQSKLISKFKLSQKQAQAILELRLQRLTALEQDKIRKKHVETKNKIKELEEILTSGEKVIDIIRKELLEIRRKYGDNRRTKILEHVKEVKEIDLIKKETVAVILTSKGYIKRMPLKLYQEQRRGGKGISGTELTSDDIVQQVFVCSTHDSVLFLTKRGLLYKLKAYQIPEATRYSKGKAIINLLNISDAIKVVIPVQEFKGDIVIATHLGIIKRVSLDNFIQIRKVGVKAIGLPQNDVVVDAKLSKSSEEEVMLATKKGIAARFNLKDVRSMGKTAYGVTAIKLAMNDELIGFELLSKELIKGHTILSITEKGYGKRTKIEDYRKTARACKGIININCSQRNGEVVAISLVTGKDSIIVTTTKGMVIRVPCKDIREMGRNTQGVRIIRLRDGDKVSDVVKIKVEEN